jgi:hypothetical protein
VTIVEIQPMRIPTDVLLGWCQEDPVPRYSLAASIITFWRRPELSDSPVWSDQAEALLAGAPDPNTVLAVFIGRFWPRTWSGSRAAVVEANSKLLDSLAPHIQCRVGSLVAEAKAQLAQEIARDRQLETATDRSRDERFE